VRKIKQYWNKWITVECWIDIINERFEMPANLKFNAANLTRAISRDSKYHGIDITHVKNIHGVFKAQFKTETTDKRRVMLTAYYVTSPNSLPQKPGGNKKWPKKIVSSAPEPPLSTRQTTVKRSIPVVGPAPTADAPIQKRRRQDTD
jgi:hypothetical protein